MNTVRMSNIPLAEFRKFLFYVGCTRVDKGQGRGGHEKWYRPGLKRPVIIQNHIDPIPERVVRSNLNTLGVSRKDFEKWLLDNH